MLRRFVSFGYLRTDTRLPDGTIALRTVVDLSGDATLFICALWARRTPADRLAAEIAAHDEQARARLAAALAPAELWARRAGGALFAAGGLALGGGGASMGLDVGLLSPFLPAGVAIPAWVGGLGNTLLTWGIAWPARHRVFALGMRRAGPWVLRLLLRRAVFATAGSLPSDPERRERPRGLRP